VTTPDLINGTFELLGGYALWRNVRQLYQDKEHRGVTTGATAFFMSWGYWNLYYYPHLDQWWSFVGDLNIVAANTVWLVLMIYYARRKHAQHDPRGGAGTPLAVAWYGTIAVRPLQEEAPPPPLREPSLALHILQGGAE